MESGDRIEAGAFDKEQDGLVGLWRLAHAGVHHGGGCGCGVPHATLSPAAIERAVLDYLLEKYASERRSALEQLVAVRQASESRDAPKPSFPSWLRSLANVPLAEEDRSILVADLATTLASFSAVRPAREHRVGERGR